MKTVYIVHYYDKHWELAEDQVTRTYLDEESVIRFAANLSETQTIQKIISIDEELTIRIHKIVFDKRLKLVDEQTFTN